MHDDLYFWRVLLLGIAGLGQTLFVFVYITLRWQDSDLGKVLFSNAVILAALLDLGWAANTFGFRNLDIVFIILYVPFAIGIWWQYRVFLHIKREGSKNGNRSIHQGDNEQADHSV